MTRKTSRPKAFFCVPRACVCVGLCRAFQEHPCVEMADGVVVHLLVTAGRTNEQGAGIDLCGNPEGNTSLS